MDTMTLKKLHARLGQIIQENEARGRPDRNELPVVASFTSRKGRRKACHPVQFGCGGSLGIGGVLSDEAREAGAPENVVELMCGPNIVR